MQARKLIRLLQEDRTEDEELLKCEDCGIEDVDVSLTICPFSDEVHDERIWVQICGACYIQRLDDV